MKKNAISKIPEVLLILLILVGIAFRFLGMNWSSGANLHPDEYGLTNTLTQLSFPRSFEEYFNTRISPISPYNKYDFFGQLIQNGPDNRMRWGQWPIILIRGSAELSHNTGYDELRRMGRYLSAVVDTLTLSLTFLIGRRLYGTGVGILGTAFSSLAVMQIQQSHFMTVDNYAVFFSMLAMYAAVRIAQTPPLVRVPADGGRSYVPYRTNRSVYTSYILYGIALGMALASKINLFPLAGMLLVASFVSIADLKLKTTLDIKKIFKIAGILVVMSYIVTAGTYRITQPMSFRAPFGNTNLLTVHLNPDWVDSMEVSLMESKGGGGGPPAEQWADRAIIIFPLMNMVVWGLGFPLGVAAWYGWGRAAWQILQGASRWRQHILPVTWVGGFFLFMATRWVKSIRYFLPIYPFLCLLAAWSLLSLFNRFKNDPRPRLMIPRAVAKLLIIIVIVSTFAWASAFTQAVYVQPNTRIRATRWILQNIPAPIHIRLTTNDQVRAFPISVQDGTMISSIIPFQQYVRPEDAGELTTVTLPHVLNPSDHPTNLTVSVSLAENPLETVGQASLEVLPLIGPRGDEVSGVFNGGMVSPNKDYLITVSTVSITGMTIFQNTIASEEWDEGLPVLLDGYNPYDGFYRGITMPVRWTDDDTKRETLLKNLEQVDYIILASQRALWSVCRLQKMYPMTIEYYRALFNGRLGFSKIALFQAPWKFGLLQISDAGGTVTWGESPNLPVFNFNFLAAEEAFTVYDHAPVWIFKKDSDYSQDYASSILSMVDLKGAYFQSPADTKVMPIK